MRTEFRAEIHRAACGPYKEAIDKYLLIDFFEMIKGLGGAGHSTKVKSKASVTQKWESVKGH